MTNKLLEEYRAKCRELELETFELEKDFRYKARELWWEYSQATQKEGMLYFKEFWGDERSYPRTIANN